MAGKKAKKTLAKTPEPFSFSKNDYCIPFAAIGLLVNILIFFLPGLGSVIGGRTRTGFIQISLAIIIGIIHMITSIPSWISFILLGLVWLWGIGTGINMIRSC